MWRKIWGDKTEKKTPSTNASKMWEQLWSDSNTVEKSSFSGRVDPQPVVESVFVSSKVDKLENIPLFVEEALVEEAPKKVEDAPKKWKKTKWSQDLAPQKPGVSVNFEDMEKKLFPGFFAWRMPGEGLKIKRVSSSQIGRKIPETKSPEAYSRNKIPEKPEPQRDRLKMKKQYLDTFLEGYRGKRSHH